MQTSALLTMAAIPMKMVRYSRFLLYRYYPIEPPSITPATPPMPYNTETVVASTFPIF